jgi:hypothetical protein
MHVLLDTDRDCDLLQDRPVLNRGHPMTKLQLFFDYNQDLFMNPIGAWCQDWLTDHQL